MTVATDQPLSPPGENSLSSDQASVRRPVFDGLRIVDQTQGLPGPVATRLLAETGADVIKVEPPQGDEARWLSPAGFATWNRSKRMVHLDLSQPADLSRLHGLLAGADVLVHDLTQRQARERGLDDHALSGRWPHLVAASVTGYPDGHPDEDRPARELLVQARLGAMDEQQALRPGPMYVRLPFASWGAAYLLAGGIAARLFERLRTGIARPIHTSLLQAALAPASLYWQRAGDPPEWLLRNTLRRDYHPSDQTIFQCADGRWIHVLGGFSMSPTIQAELTAAGLAEFVGTAVTPETRGRWSTVFATRTVDEWCAALWPEGVICVGVLDVGEILAAEQARVNGYAVEVEDERFGSTVQAGSPVLVDPPALVRAGAPWSSDLTAENVIAEWGSLTVPRRPDGVANSPALEGIRVLDFGSYVAGPFGGQCLADFGADVIKVEPPWGERGRAINQFTGCQRGKRSLAIDLLDGRSRDVLRRLIASADVVTHNIRDKAARRLGIDEASVRAVNPGIVFAHATSYGLNGPWADFGAFDPSAFALSGWEINISGSGNRPTWLRNSTMDCHTGMNVFLATVMGLYQHATQGGGASVSTSLLGTAVMSTSESLLVTPSRTPTPIETVTPDQTGTSPGHRIYPVRDGWVAVAALTAIHQQALLAVADVTDLDDIAGVFADRSAPELLLALDDAGVPAEPVALNNRDRFFDQELALGTGLVERTQTLPYGWFENPGGFWSDETGVVRHPRPIPGVGEHTLEVLGNVGLNDTEVKELWAVCVVSTEPIPAPASRTSNALTRSLNR